jgi:hypothetical protein
MGLGVEAGVAEIRGVAVEGVRVAMPGYAERGPVEDLVECRCLCANLCKLLQQPAGVRERLADEEDDGLAVGSGGIREVGGWGGLDG